MLMIGTIALLLLLVVIVCGPKMAEEIPPLVDANLVLQASVTKTASFDSAALDRGSGFDPGGLGEAVAGIVTVTAGTRADGDETYNFKLQQSADGSTGWEDIGVNKAVTVDSTTFTTGTYMCKGFATKRYQRLVLTAAGTTPSITYAAWLRPCGMAGR